jgi:ureidoglycolate hydrolase
MENLKVIELKVERLDKKNFAPYGEIIGPQKAKADLENDDIAFYPGISHIELTKQGGMFSWLEVKKPRKFICENLERHINCTESMIPFGGSSICVVALSKNMNDTNSPVDAGSIRAFFMDGSLAVNLKKGAWHWIPFPISEKASFIVVFEKETHKKDLEIIDLKKDYNLSVKLIFEK